MENALDSTTGKRNYNIDLIKLLAMFLVVSVHLTSTENIEGGSNSAVTTICVRALNVVSYCCVNLFALASGYLLCTNKIKAKRALSLWTQVFFYSVAVYVVSFLISGDKSLLSAYAVTYLLPVIFSKYWYISIYFVLYLFVPFFNKLIESINKKQMFWLVSLMLVCFSVIPTVFQRDAFFADYKLTGYSIVWMTTLYFVGAYIRKYGLKVSKLMLVILSAVSFAANLGMRYLKNESTVFGIKGIILDSYSSLTVFIMSLSIFYLMLNMKIHIEPKAGRVIKAFSASSLAVYLIHTHPVVFNKWIVGNFTWVGAYSAPAAVLITLGIALAITVSCCAVEMLRDKLFELIRINRLCDKAGDKLTVMIHKISDKVI